jgi:hypothetical protein
MRDASERSDIGQWSEGSFLFEKRGAMRGGDGSSVIVRREKSKLGKEEMEMVSVIKQGKTQSQKKRSRDWTWVRYVQREGEI